MTALKLITAILILPALYLYFAIRGGDIGLERNWS
jgi:hypothetical protein